MIISGDSIDILKFSNLAEYSDINHFVTTRNGGYSKSPYNTLNLGLHVEDDADAVNRNRFRVAAETSIPPAWFVAANQVHGSNVAVITKQMRGSGASSHDSAIAATDAMITNEEDVCLMILTADCAPILLYDPVRRAAGAVHAGWKSTVKRIAVLTINSMVNRFGCNPADIIAGIGPSIGPCCFTVNEDVLLEIEGAIGKSFTAYDANIGKRKIDLWEANREQLISAGVLDRNIEVSKICTFCNTDTYFSYRAEGITGRFGTGIMILNEICASCTTMHCSWCNKE